MCNGYTVSITINQNRKFSFYCPKKEISEICIRKKADPVDADRKCVTAKSEKGNLDNISFPTSSPQKQGHRIQFQFLQLFSVL